MRCIQALDNGKRITFKELKKYIFENQLFELLADAGNYPGPDLIPEEDRTEINNCVREVWAGNLGDENEQFYIQNDGYCLLVALFHEIELHYAFKTSRLTEPPTDPVVRITQWTTFSQQGQVLGHSSRQENDTWISSAVDEHGNRIELGNFTNLDEANSKILEYHD